MEQEATTQGKPEQLSLKANMLWNSAGSLVFLGCQWLITILVVRLSSGYEAAGVLALAMSTYNIFAPFAVYRMYTYQVSDVHHENSAGEYLAFRVITCTISLAVGLVYAFFTCTFSALGAVALYFLFKIAGLLIDVLHGVDQLNGRMDYIGQSLSLQGVGTLAAFCSVFYLTQSLEAGIGAMIAVTVVIGLAFDTPRTRRFETIRFGISRAKVKHLLLYCAPIVMATIACSAAPNIPRQYLAYLQGEAALGIYASVAVPVAIIQMGASYIYNPMLSTFAEHYASGRTRELMVLFAKAIAGIAAVGIVCAVLLELCGPWLLGLMYGESILPYVYVLGPAIACACATAYVWFTNDMLVALRNFTGSVVGNVSAFAISVPATYVFVNAYGMNGVSFAGIAAYAIGAVIMAVFLFAGLRKPPKHPECPDGDGDGAKEA